MDFQQDLTIHNIVLCCGTEPCHSSLQLTALTVHLEYIDFFVFMAQLLQCRTKGFEFAISAIRAETPLMVFDINCLCSRRKVSKAKGVNLTVFMDFFLDVQLKAVSISQSNTIDKAASSGFRCFCNAMLVTDPFSAITPPSNSFFVLANEIGFVQTYLKPEVSVPLAPCLAVFVG